MKPIRFTTHDLGKLSRLKRRGFGIDEKTVLKTIRQPQRVSRGYSDRFIAQSMLDEEHVLRVVYQEDEHNP